MNVQEAAKRLNKSEPTIRRWIRRGKLEASMVDGVYDIPELEVYEQSMSVHITDDDQGSQIAVLRANAQSLENQLNDKNERIDKLQEELKQAREELHEAHRFAEEAGHRHDTVVMQMTKLLEYHQQPFWRKLFSRKALSGAIDEKAMDINPENNKSK